MNKIFKLVWNSQLQMLVVASEFAKGYIYSSSKRVFNDSPNDLRTLRHFEWGAIPAALSLLACPVSAADIQVFDFTPQNSFEEVLSGSNRLVGSFAGIQRGMTGYTWTTLGQARDNGLITGDSAKWIDYDILRMGSQTKSINYIDPITGNTVTMKVYDNSDIQTEPAKDFGITISVPVGTNSQYVDRNFYQIGSGASLDVSVGQTTENWVGAAENQFNVILKSSSNNINTASVFHATDGGEINYLSKTVVQLGNNDNNIRDASNPVAWMTAADFVGSFDSVIGAQNVTNVAEFKAYNDALIQAIKEGKIQLTEAEYSSELNKARDQSLHGIVVNTSNIASDDAVRATVNRDVVSYIHAEGAGSNVNIDADANIQLVGSDAMVVNLENGATLVNDGTLGSAGNTYRGAYVVSARNTSFVENNGVIDAGTNPEMADFFQAGAMGVANGSHTAVLANGASIINNNASGVINLAARGNYQGNTGVLLSSSATLNNFGAINIAASTEADSILGNAANIGVITQQNTTFNNEGTLYIGRLAQRAPTDVTEDIAIKQSSIGVHLYGNGTYNGTNNSEIIIGSKVQNATAIDVGGSATLAQQGTIQLNGAVSGSSVSSNTGILVREGTSASKVVNSGTIDINGLNSTGIKVLANGQITSSGTINVNGGLDPVSHYANYGIYAQGENAQATLSGTVNLTGDGAIGVHARDKGEINVTQDGTVAFNGGTNQTGYYVYGAGSSIKNSASSVQDVSTTDSTLYRVDGGAAFDGSGSSSAQLYASGDGATIVRTTGEGSTFSSGRLELNVTGDGATGIRIEGGATGEITSDTVITVAGKGTTAGIVDGNYYDLDGSENAAKKGDSVLVSYAELASSNTADDAFGYIARNGGTLVHKGSIDFTAANSTGILVSGGILDNQSTVSVNGVAVNIQGANSEVKNSGTVTATNGTAAYLVGRGASLNLNGDGVTNAAGSAHGILLDDGASGLSVDGATITMSDNGSGSAIENKANISGIQLKDTTINVGNGIGVHTGASMAQTNSGTINVTGSGTGILFENVDGSQTDQVLDMSDSRELVINVNQAGGRGIVTNASTDLHTGASVNVLDSNGGAALIVQGSTQRVVQSGTLRSQSTTSPVIDINNGHVSSFVNNGAIQALDSSRVAISTNSGSGIAFTNAAGASIQGQVNLLSGDNQITLESGSTGNDFTTGNGNDLFLLSGISESETALFTSLNGGSGDDTLRLDNSAYVVSRAGAINGMEHIDLINGSTLTLDDITLALGDGQNDATGTGYSIDASSTLALKADGDLAFNSHLSGRGTVTVDANNGNVDFTSNNANDGFSGTVALSNSRFELAGLNAQALSNATLSIGSGNVTHVGNGVQHIGGLTFDGGTASFDDVTPGNAAADGTIQSASMDLLGRGTVQVNINAVNNDRPVANTQSPILEQDDGQALIMLATSDTAVQGSAGNLTLVNSSGNVISDAVEADISQNGNVVARGTYDYRLTSGSHNDGLYVNYGLTQVELLGQGTEALILDANGKTGNAADLSAKVTGSGDLALDSQSGQTVSLSNMDNDYTGVTDVRSGNLLMLNDNVLGSSAELKLAADTAFDMNGHSQTIGQLSGAADSTLNINGGSLTLAHGGHSAGTLTGSGALNVSDNTLTVSGANAALSAVTTIASTAQVVLDNTLGLGTGDVVAAGKLALNAAEGVLHNNISNSGQVELTASQVTLAGNNADFDGRFDIDGSSQLTASQANQLGSADIHNQGELVLNAADDWTLSNAVDGSGSLTKQGLGSLTLTSSAVYTGDTNIQQGSLVLGSETAPITLASQQVNVASAGTLSGFGGTAGHVDNAGTFQLGNGASSPIQTFTVGGNLTNSGQVNLGSEGQSAGNRLVVNGNYHGDGGLLRINTVLGNDASETDKLVVTGNTSGSTDVVVNNVLGAGAQTVNGIEVIHVDGQSDGQFTLKNRAVAGAYEYFLHKDGVSAADGNWYLRSTTQQGPNPTPEGDQDDKVYRPESGSYLGNIATANAMFNLRLEDREGRAENSSMWLRQVGGHTRFRDSSDQLRNQTNRYVVQGGGEVANVQFDKDSRLGLGVMLGYGKADTNTHSSLSDYSSRGSVEGYNAGLYGTWYQDANSLNGMYVDSWINYSWLNATVNGEQLSSESYNIRGYSASMETGYRMPVYQGENGSVFVTPQGQIIWNGLKADDHRESNGTWVKSGGRDNIQTRMGLKVSRDGVSDADKGKDKLFTVYAEANWLYNGKPASVTMNGDQIKQAGTRNIGELKLGTEGQLNKSLNLWTNVSQQLGDKGYSDTSVNLGIKYRF
ncbi:autotransporter outer membrane beta-barrel domain-containing protein [Leminorella grimontii]|uniref:autotransporter outer membrane beta-barrel domain-containing protein n=1 Tax=Leminorella grimontii TaxID=82981 RepID=UPI00321F6D7A